jgi:hypothetical protein
MRVAILAAVLAATVARNGCGDGGHPGYDPCAEKGCGEACHVCPPGDTGCVETAELKACDPWGQCVSLTTPFQCPMPDPCAGLTCGDECLISLPCHFAVPPCEAPQRLGHCDTAGQCVEGDPGACAPHPDCVGKACGDGCNPCGPDQVCPTFAATACDRFGRCVTALPGLCDDPCAGKACGEACDPCGGLCMHPYASACDPKGACVPAWSGICGTP